MSVPRESTSVGLDAIGVQSWTRPAGGADLRLVPTALTVWISVAGGVLLHWVVCVTTAALAALIAVWLLISGRWHRPAAVAMLLGGLLCAGVLGAQLRTQELHPLRDDALRSSPVNALVEVTNRAKPLSTPGVGGQQGGVRTVLIAADLVRAEVDEHVVTTPGKVLLFAPPQGWSHVLIGQRFAVHATLAPARGRDLTVAVLHVRDPPEQSSSADFGQREAEHVRGVLREAVVGLPKDEAGLLPGLVDGDVSGQSPSLAADFRTAGLTHLTAVSGANLAVITGAVLLLARALRIGPRCSAVVAGATVFAFVLFAGPDPTVLRAAVMGAVGLAALALGRERSAMPALATAVLVLVSLSPAMAVNIGFLLSTLATAALVLVAPKWSAGLQRRGVPLALAQTLAVPAAAHVVTAPVIAGISRQVSVVAILANLLVAPVVAPATVIGVLAALIGLVCMPLAHVVAWLAEPEVFWIVHVASTSADLPLATLPWPSGWWGAFLLALSFAAIVLLLRYRTTRVMLALVLAALLVIVVPPKALHPGWPAREWAMVSCDVGQGDAEVLATSTAHRAVLVDTGPDDDAVDDCLNRLGVKSLALVIISHLHADHVGGLVGALRNRSVGAIAVSGSRTPHWAWQQLQRTAEQAGVRVVQLEHGQRLALPGLGLDVLGPLPAQMRPLPADADGTSINNTSIVVRARTSAGSILLTGDTELQAQADLLASGVDLHASVLKIPHHGSRYSLPAFLDATGARVAIASAGAANPYGHPNPLTLAHLREHGALVLRTDQDGDVAVVANQSGHGPGVLRRGSPRPPPNGARR